jgi:phosphopantothenoylcysteine decarboxylase/phosphopantothenate--cysteine ligase
VGFAAEHGEQGIERARQKRRRKELDLIVFNDISQPGLGFEAPDNAITIVGPDEQETRVPASSKAVCAERILDIAGPLITS